MNKTKPIIIIGTGLAGYTLAREFRKLDKTRPLFMITADDGGFYSKPMLSNAFEQGKDPTQLVSQSAAQMASQLGATMLTGTRVEHIDTAAKRIGAGGGSFEYDKLVLAVGAQPIRLGIPGNASHEIQSVNNLQDYALFRQRIARREGKARITILGAGLIGCEFADDLAGAGHQVTVVDPNPLPLSALAAPALSRGLHAALAERGVDWRLATTAAYIDRNDDALQVTLADRHAFETDVVLSAVGLRPDVRIAQTAGLKTARGIVVDACGQTSAPDVYALGDCAEYPVDGSTAVLPYIAPMMSAARAIASTLAGEPKTIDMKLSPVIVKTPSFPLALLPPPAHANTHGAWQETQYGTQIVCRYFDADGVLVGFGVAPQDTAVRLSLLSELGSRKVAAAA